MLDCSGPRGSLGPPARDKRPSWKKAKPPIFTPETTAADALAEIVLSGINHLRGNEACVLARCHTEGVHQMRVATRRLRSCLTIYQHLLPPDEHRHLVGELKWLIGELGPARDWDVFLEEVLVPVMDGMPGERSLARLRLEAEAVRDDAYGHAQAAIQSQRYFGLVLLLSAWARGHRWHEHASSDGPPQLLGPAIAFASEVIAERHREVLAAGEDFPTLNAEQRHAVRIQIKKLRYALEFFSSLYSRRKYATYLAGLKKLQDALGTSNDVEVARTLLARVAKTLRGKERARFTYAAGLVVGWHSHVAGDRERDVTRLWEDYCRGEPFWSAGAPPSDSASGPAEGAIRG
ncbi:MAG: CHAD domain-containing protein [Rhodospirillales bacterium]